MMCIMSPPRTASHHYDHCHRYDHCHHYDHNPDHDHHLITSKQCIWPAIISLKGKSAECIPSFYEYNLALNKVYDLMIDNDYTSLVHCHQLISDQS